MQKSIIMSALALATLVTALAAPALAQQPWWCNRAPKNCTEAVICQTPQLGRLDVRMAARYHALQDVSSRRGARRLLNSQRRWLRARNSCGCNANCLISYYRGRINLFDDILN